jgi:hypothetical protein
MKLLLVILFVIMLMSKGNIIEFLSRETPVISKKVGNYTTVDKLFPSNINVFICFLIFQFRIGFLVTIGLEPYNYQNAILFGPTFVFKQSDQCSQSIFQRRFNVSLDFENPEFCEENYCNHYTLSSFSISLQILAFFVTEFLLTNSNVMCVLMATTNQILLRK